MRFCTPKCRNMHTFSWPSTKGGLAWPKTSIEMKYAMLCCQSYTASTEMAWEFYKCLRLEKKCLKRIREKWPKMGDIYCIFRGKWNKDTIECFGNRNLCFICITCLLMHICKKCEGKIRAKKLISPNSFWFQLCIKLFFLCLKTFWCAWELGKNGRYFLYASQMNISRAPRIRLKFPPKTMKLTS